MLLEKNFDLGVSSREFVTELANFHHDVAFSRTGHKNLDFPRILYPAAMSGNNSEGLMHDPYASSGSSGSLMTPPPLPSADDFHPVAPSSAPADDLFLNIPSAKPPQPDFLYDENYDESFRRSWGERLTYHVGAAYSAGAQAALYLAARPVPHACRRGLHAC